MNFRRTGDKSMKQAMEAWLKEVRLDRRLAESRLVESWPVLMGPMVANRTVSVRLYEGTLYVALNSATLREELTHSRDKIVQLLNREAGAEVVKEVVFR